MSYGARVALGLVALLASLAVVGGVSIAVYRFVEPPPREEVVTPAPQVRQADGSVIAERAPRARRAGAPPHQLPRGAVEERRQQVVVAPAPAASSVEVDLSLIRLPGDERRVVASSPDGQVLSAIDIPIDPSPLPPAPRRWAAGLSYGTDRAVGTWVERDVGRLRLGAEVARRPDGQAEGRVRVGVTW